MKKFLMILVILLTVNINLAYSNWHRGEYTYEEIMKEQMILYQIKMNATFLAIDIYTRVLLNQKKPKPELEILHKPFLNRC